MRANLTYEKILDINTLIFYDPASVTLTDHLDGGYTSCLQLLA
jgi:hypothetical protein